MTAGVDHPHLLPWYAAGTLPEHDVRDVERHLATCRRCREQVVALRSMGDTLRRAHAPAPLPQASRRFRPVLAAGVAAAAVIALVAVAWFVPFGSGRVVTPTTGGVSAADLTLTPTLRGGRDEPSLSGTAPWTVRVVLPATAPDGTYRLVLDPAVPGAAAVVVGDLDSHDGVIEARLGATPQYGRFDLIVRPVGTGAAEFVYPLVVRPAEPGAAAR